MAREMKDSEIEWIGSIPKNWLIIPLKYCLTEIIDMNYPIKSSNILSLVKDKGVIPYEEKGDVGNKSKEDISQYKLAYPNTIVLNSMNILIGSVGITKYLGCVSPVYYVFIETKDSDIRFINYIFSTREFQKELRKYANGILEIRLRVSSFDIFKRKIPVPLKETQQMISDFLDHKCSQIDSLIADITKEIELLKEYTNSLIYEKINSSNYKQCVETRLGYECFIRARLGWKGLKADEYVEEGFAFISAFNIQNNKLVWNPINHITKQRYDESPEIKLSVGDVLIVKDGAGIGKCARIDSLPEGAAAPNSSLGVLTPYARLEYRYLCYFLQSKLFKDQMKLLLTGMGVPHLTQEALHMLRINLPLFEEQERIANYLDLKCSQVDSLISDKQQQIGKLTDYKKSLIYEYITGKKEVLPV